MELRLAEQQEIESALAQGQPLALVPLGLDMGSCATVEEMHSNFYATLDRGYTSINDLLYKHTGKVCVVGAGPSIEETYKDLAGDVFAINSAIGYLISKNIIPKWAMIWDASPLCKDFAMPHPEVTYLVASRCHPDVFERLKDCKVIVWHAAGDHDIVNIMNKPEVIAKQKESEPLVNGGSAGVTRGIFVANALGYNDIHIFGADSSYQEDKTHINGSLVPEKDMIVSIGSNPPTWFRTTPEWVAQVEEYRGIFLMMTHHNIKLEVHGTGLLPTLHTRMVDMLEKKGLEEFTRGTQEQLEDRRKLNAEASKNAEALHA